MTRSLLFTILTMYGTGHLSISCSGEHAVSARAQALQQFPCFDPVQFGDDASEGIQFAINAATAAPNGGTVCVGPGEWPMHRAAPGTPNRFAALFVRGRKITIRGAGPQTVLKLVGDQGASAVAVLSIDPGTENLLLTDFDIDTSGSTNTDEQTHAIGTSAVCTGDGCRPIRNVQIDHLTIVHPRNTPSRKGDDIRLFGGSAATRVDGFRITNSNFEGCSRSAIQIQRWVTNVVIASNNFSCLMGDQTVDGEASGDGGDEGICIMGNTFNDGPNMQGDFSITLSRTTRATVMGNTMNRGIGLIWTTDTAVSGNAIVATTKGDRGLIDVSNTCDGITLTGNTIRRAGHAGPLVKMTPLTAGCRGVTVVGNSMGQGTVAPAIDLESPSSSLVVGNRIVYGVSAVGQAAITVHSVGTPVTDLVIAANVISGPVTRAVTLHAYPGTMGPGISVVGNVATGTVFGLVLENTGLFTAPVTSSGNATGPTVAAGAQVLPGT